MAITILLIGIGSILTYDIFQAYIPVHGRINSVILRLGTI